MPESILSVPPPSFDRRIRYGEAPQHFADVRFPAGDHAAPVLFNVHGGFWRAKYDLAHAGHFCAALAKAGLITINVEYRRVADPGGGWPGTLEDLRGVLRYAVQHAKELRIDARRITVSGHSAGGQLALCLAAHEPQIVKAVSLAGVLDARRAWDLHLSHDAVVEFLGGTPEQAPDHYKEASPMELAIGVKQVVIHGTKDDVVPVEFSRDYSKSKSRRGENVRYVELDGADHYDMIDPRAKYWSEIRKAILEVA